MIYQYYRKFRGLFNLPIQECDKEEFYIGLNETNVSRGKITSIIFIVMEVLVLILSFLVKRENNLDKPGCYYVAMYLIMIFGMTVFWIVFTRLKKDVPKYNTIIQITGIVYAVFILVWSAIIALLDQLSGGEIIVYIAAIMAVAVTPLYRPIILLKIYLTVQLMFLILLPYFNFGGHLFGNSVNSTTIIIVSWAIACMRYRNRAEDFLNRKEIQMKNEELARLNLKLEEANQKLKVLSRTDSLTGIYNRSVFDKMLNREWGRCKDNSTYLSLIMIDVDFFKAFNDNYGHQAGDDCLKQVAEVISDCCEHTSDTVVRYGGEEFAIILPDREKDSAYRLAEKMRYSIEAKKMLHEHSAISNYITISLGVNTVIPSENLSVEDLIRTADKALYKAKQENRNKVVVA